ncbi:hypothetical protein BAMA111019_04610 [Bacillus manliponensis]
MNKFDIFLKLTITVLLGIMTIALLQINKTLQNMVEILGGLVNEIGRF